MSEFDLPMYFSRIGVSGPVKPDLETLRALHLGHVTSIVFENLDIFLGRPIRIDLDSVFGKLVRLRRGGYCFEHNTLFAAALESIGYEVTRLGARVGPGDPRVLMRTHMLLAVRAGGTEYLADVGFGAGGLFEPIPMHPGEPIDQYGQVQRLVHTDVGFALEERRNGEWRVMYQFTREPLYAPDVVIANHYTSTHPDSAFVRTLTAQRRSIDVQWTLRNSTLIERRGDKESITTIPSAEALLVTLAETFGLSFPPGTVLRPPGRPES